MAATLVRSHGNSNGPVDIDTTSESNDVRNGNLNRPTRRSSQRYSNTDGSSVLAAGSAASPASAKRALEAHLAETNRRLTEASELGTALVQQRQSLTERLHEVEQQQHQHEIGPALRQKLADVEREYQEVGQDSARAFIATRQQHQQPLTQEEAVDGQPPATPTRSGRHQRPESPSKAGAASRRHRNQSSNRVQDIEFVTDISTSLLGQVRQLQGLLAERDDALRKLSRDKEASDANAQAWTQRIKSLDENQQRYRDENWTLETEGQELRAAAKEHTAREQRLQQALGTAQSERSLVQRELDDVRTTLTSLQEEQTAARRVQEAEASQLRREAANASADFEALHRKLELVTTQNQELARLVAHRQHDLQQPSFTDETLVGDHGELENSELDHSPPPSPSKSAARSSVLESETLKSSLQHAHRMIQNLKSGIHREKTEKLELKRMLQDTRDELEANRGDTSAAAQQRRLKNKLALDPSKRGARNSQLGAQRSSRLDITPDEDEAWQDHDSLEHPRTAIPPSSANKSIAGSQAGGTNGDQVDQSAAETDAFETANERDTTTETEAFQTGAESIAGDSSGEQTETETPAKRRVVSKGAKPMALASAKRQSYMSTASTSEDEVGSDKRTPTTQPPKYRLKLGRNSRRSRVPEDPSLDSSPPANGSPASFMSGNMIPGQSLFTELGSLEDAGSVGTPDSRVSNQDGLPGRANLGAREGSNSASNTPSQGLISRIFSGKNSPSNVRLPSSPLANNERGIGRGLDEIPSPVEGVASFPVSSEKTFEASEAQESDPLLRSEVLSFSDIQSVDSSPSTGTRGASHAQAAGIAAGLPLVASSDSAGADGSQLALQGLGRPVQTSKEAEVGATETKGNFGATNDSAKSPVSSNVPQSMTLPEARRRDNSSQTRLTGNDLEEMFANGSKDFAASKTNSTDLQREPLVPSKRVNALAGAMSNPRGAPASEMTASRSSRRLGTSNSQQASRSDRPPLPMDHRQNIVAAQSTSAQDRGSVMGPPLFPASAMQSPVRKMPLSTDPNGQTIGTATSRARHSSSRVGRSRRSSMSSFESEIDARFNARAGGMLMPPSDANTDPRMIQAITQTMIGEWLWKYTRKAGRGDMSGKRHRRFFWVHPYTRTLYWSDQDPSSAGRAPMKAKSVAIEAVRVVVDDNPMPPGLHRKSLLVITPGRDVKFTATTGQRHETWFNALSYLLLRSSNDPHSADPSQLTAEEIAEFNPSLSRGLLSRASLSSYNSRQPTVRQSRNSSRDPSPSKNSYRQIPATPHAATTSSRFSRDGQHLSLASRISSYVRPGHASVSERNGSIYNASVVNDSAEDMRAVLARQEQDSDRLENVRACCDGKHDVGSLTHRSGSNLHRLSTNTNRSRRSFQHR